MSKQIALPPESSLYQGLDEKQCKQVRDKLNSILSPLPALMPQIEKLRLIIEIRKELGPFPQLKAKQFIDLSSCKVVDQNTTSDCFKDLFVTCAQESASKLQKVEDNIDMLFQKKKKPDVTPR